MERAKTITRIFFLSIVGIYLAGCSDRFWDPKQIGRFRPTPAVNVILDSLGVAEEEPPAWEGAEQPRPMDIVAFERDYVFRPGDVVRISIYELFREGLAVVSDHVVTETGKISIPEVGVVQAAGLTETQLEDEIKQILSPGILKEPQVTVTLLGSEQRTFSIIGDGIPAPGRYIIPRYDFRLTDALATAGGISDFNISYVYVSRSAKGERPVAAPAEPTVTEPEKLEELIEPEQPEEQVEPEEEMLEVIEPQAGRQWSKNRLVITSAEMVTDEELTEAASPEDFEPAVGKEQNNIDAEGVLKSSGKSAEQAITDESTKEDESDRIEWIFKDGKWVPVQVGPPKPIKPAVKVEPGEVVGPLERMLPEELEWEQALAAEQTRVIKIPTDKLLGGDPRYNIVIRPGDDIYVPVDIIGEFCIMGNVNRQGYINLTGRPMTLKMAIAAAGGLGELAWPKKVEVVRRIGRNKEEIVMVDLDRISRGEQPDFFIKPDDLINVGTHPTSQWRYALRNAFSARYGFWLDYYRNFAAIDAGKGFHIGDITGP
jgi:polysaccharide export outer membrane protein